MSYVVWASANCTSQYDSHASLASDFNHKACSDHGTRTKASFIQITPQINTMMLKAIILYIKHQESVFFFSHLFFCVSKTLWMQHRDQSVMTAFLTVSPKDLLWEGAFDVPNMHFRFCEHLKDLWGWWFLWVSYPRIFLSFFVLIQAKFLVMNLLSSYFHFSV